jgi:hypothetical protein
MPWQIVLSRVWDSNGDDPAMVKRVTGAVWKMEKLDLAKLERAAAGLRKDLNQEKRQSRKLRPCFLSCVPAFLLS